MAKSTREPQQYHWKPGIKSSLILDHAYDNLVPFERMELACQLVDALPAGVDLPAVWWSELNNCHEFVWQHDDKILRAWILDGQIALYAQFGREEREAIEDYTGSIELPKLLGELLQKAFRWMH